MQINKLMLQPTIMRISPMMSNLHCLLLFQAINMLFSTCNSKPKSILQITCSCTHSCSRGVQCKHASPFSYPTTQFSNDIFLFNGDP